MCDFGSGVYWEDDLISVYTTKHHCRCIKYLAIEMLEEGYGLRLTQEGVVHDLCGDNDEDVVEVISAKSPRWSPRESA